jgi:hypothetical protein
MISISTEEPSVLYKPNKPVGDVIMLLVVFDLYTNNNFLNLSESEAKLTDVGNQSCSIQICHQIEQPLYLWDKHLAQTKLNEPAGDKYGLLVMFELTSIKSHMVISPFMNLVTYSIEQKMKLLLCMWNSGGDVSRMESTINFCLIVTEFLSPIQPNGKQKYPCKCP